MEAEREYVWTKVPGGYRVVVEDKTIIYAPTGYMVEYAGGALKPQTITLDVPMPKDDGSIATLRLL